MERRELGRGSEKIRVLKKIYGRIAFTALVAIASGLYCFLRLSGPNGPHAGADDFTSYWLAARTILDGHSPYGAGQHWGQFHLVTPFYYPLTAALIVIPFAGWLEPIPAAALFVGATAGALAWGVSRNDYSGFPIFLSVPFLWSCTSGQVAPMMAAVALIPALSWLAPVKPNLGIATIAYHPSRVALIGATLFVAGSLLIEPTWPREWVEALGRRTRGNYRVPLAVLGGPLILLAATRWRRPEARLLLVMACVPQSMLFYDQLLLWLVPRSRFESTALSLLSFGAFYVATRKLPLDTGNFDFTPAFGQAIVALCYLPCVLIVLLRPNEGEVPRWIERIAQRTDQKRYRGASSSDLR